MHMDGWTVDRWKHTDVMMLLVMFANFPNVPKIGTVLKVTSVSLCTN